MLSPVIQCMPGIVIVGRVHMVRTETADEIVMAIEVPIAPDLDEPWTTTGTTGHITRNRNDRPLSVRPGSSWPLARSPALTIKRRSGGIPIGGKRLLGGLVVGPADPTDLVSQEALAISGHNGDPKIVMIIIGPGVDPIIGHLQITGSPATIGRRAMIVEWTEDQIL